MSAPLTAPKSELAEARLIERLHGREFVGSTAYPLPADHAEHDRLNIQHIVSRTNIDGLYVSKDLVKHALREDQLGVPSVLDIGTGSGRWALEMAQEFPHCEVLGTDLTSPGVLRSEANIPENCRFEISDANDSMDHFAQAFNVVHVRSAETGIDDFESWLYRVAKVLRPNGVLLLIAGIEPVDEDGAQYARKAFGEPGFSWIEYLFSGALAAMKSKGSSNIEAGRRWTGWLEKNPNYDRVVTEDFLIPIGPWKGNMSEREATAAKLMRDDLILLFPAFKPLLLGSGWDTAAVDQAITNATQELEDQSIRSHFKWRYTTAVRTPLNWKDQVKSS